MKQITLGKSYYVSIILTKWVFKTFSITESQHKKPVLVFKVLSKQKK